MKKKAKPSFGREIIDGLKELHGVLASGEPVERHFTVRSVKLDLTPGRYRAKDVRATRAALGVSQAIFAQLLGTSSSTVQSWEQGKRIPPPMACRLLDQMNADRNRWLQLLRDSVKAAV
jgi:putative transcriptional regulator